MNAKKCFSMDALIDVAMTRLFRLAEYVCDRMAVKPAEYVYGNAAVKPSGSVCDVAAVKPAECVCDRGSKRTGSVLCLETSADTRTAAMALAVGRSDCRD